MLSKDIVRHVARLARLRFSDEELEALTAELATILKYIEKLNKLDTDNVAPLMHVLPITNVLREDEVTKSLSREDALMNAPEKVKGFFAVPKIIE
jgi:aspartyl-tRNA(Asn)/glutamyl-tRNA(Gln) amidotransferase subunit C